MLGGFRPWKKLRGEIEKGTDMRLHFKLQSLVQKDEGAARMAGRMDADGTSDTEPHLPEYGDLFDFAMGFELEGWSKSVFDSLAEAEAFLGNMPVDAIKKSLIVKPFDYTKKKLWLLVDDKREEGIPARAAVLRASTVELRPEDSQFVVYIPG